MAAEVVDTTGVMVTPPFSNTIGSLELLPLLRSLKRMKKFSDLVLISLYDNVAF